MSISIVTVNIEYGNRNLKKIKERSDLIIKYNPDIIFLQESNNNAIKFNNYNLINYSNINSESIDIYLKKDSNWKEYYIDEFYTTLSFTIRPCKVIFLKNNFNNKIIKLANVHLCGGRFDENDKIGGMLLGNLKDIRNKKNEILKKLIINYDIDIIAGDFNSDLKCFIDNKIQPHHLKYFLKKSPNTSINNLFEWNISPYKYLTSDNFTFAKSSELIATSIFNTHPDSIWIKNCKQTECKYINLINDNLSDHNGIYCDLLLLK